MSQRQKLIALVLVGVVLGVAVLARTTDIRIPTAIRSTLAIGLVVLGAWAVLGAVLIKLHRVQPGRIWGHSSLGSLLLGAGCFLAGIGYFPNGVEDAQFVAIVGIITFYVGAPRNRVRTMRCPKCGNRPLPFSKYLWARRTERIQCAHCQAQLQAGSLSSLWKFFHVLLGLGVYNLGKWLWRSGAFESPWAVLAFVLGLAALVSCTSRVIPYFAFKRMYRVAAVH